MPDLRSAPPFDQGMFLLHYNKGKEYFQEEDLENAQRELELAQGFRPEDEDVLNLLGLVYFKRNRHKEAEHIYRRLVQSNPNVFILHSNLGLILFKQGNMDDAEKHLARATELKPNYAKSHLYLGLLHRQRGKLDSAIEHLRFAGASKLVKEVEMEKQKKTSPLPVVTQMPPAPPPKSPHDTARLRLQKIGGGPVDAKDSSPSETQAEPFPQASQPGPPPDAASERPTKKLENRTAQIPKELVAAAAAAGAAAAAAAAPAEHSLKEAPLLEQVHAVTEQVRPEKKDASTQKMASPLVQAARRTIDISAPRKIEGASKIFTLHENGFLEINTRKSVYVKRGTVSSYTGNLKFESEKGLRGTSAQSLIRADGTGKLFLYERGRRSFLIELSNEFIFVEGGNLLAMEETLMFRKEPIFDYSHDRRIDIIKIYGKGSLAISTAVEPLTLRITKDYPLNLDASSLVAWTGNLVPAVLEDKALAEIMIHSANSFTVRFEGDGVVIAEEA